MTFLFSLNTVNVKIVLTLLFMFCHEKCQQQGFRFVCTLERDKM